MALNAKVWIAFGATMLIFATLLFGGAGTIRWTAGWVYLVLFFGASLQITLRLARDDPALLNERMKSLNQRDQPLWDKLFLAILQVLWCGWLILMGLLGSWYGLAASLMLNGGLVYRTSWKIANCSMGLRATANTRHEFGTA